MRDVGMIRRRFDGLPKRVPLPATMDPRSGHANERLRKMLTLLWIAAAILVISGITAIVRGQVMPGIALIAIGLLVGPGGVSVVG